VHGEYGEYGASLHLLCYAFEAPRTARKLQVANGIYSGVKYGIAVLSV
jgi:hypothetical protein